MATLTNLVVKLSAQTSDFNRSMNSARQKVGEFGRATARIAGGAIVAGALGLGRLAQQQAVVADSTAKLASRLGTTTEFLSEMAFVADRSGVKVEGLNVGLQRMQRRLSEAAAGNKGLQATLAELGLDETALKTMTLEQQFESVAAALSRIENPADRTRLAFKLFDTEGVALLQTLGGGVEGINALREEARALGVTITEDAAASAVEFADAMTNLQAALSGVGNTLLTEVGPGLTDFIQTVTAKLPAIIQIFKNLFLIVGQFIGGTVAILSELLSGNFKGALSVARFAEADLVKTAGNIGDAGRDLFGAKQVDEQKVTNDLLRDLVTKTGQPSTAS